MARDSSIPLQIGLRLDVLDNEGIWNTATIVDVAKDDDDDLVEIKYDGWGDEYNEWVPASKQRLAPLHMFTIVKKCWAKLTKWPWWPAFVVLRAPTKRGAVEALDAETKVYVEFFDSFDEDKRSRCWMQKKSVVSFDDNFEERAAKNVGKNFHKFVEHTQRALASSSPLLFAGSGTLPIEYSSKSPLSFVVQKQKLGNKEWFAAYTSFSNRYRVLYGFEVAKAGVAGGANKVNLPSIQGASAGADDEDAEVAEGEDYADGDESDEKDEPEEDEASVNGDEEEEEEESARGRRSARVETRQQPKRKLPARASTRRNAQKRVKVIEQLLQASSHVKRSQPGQGASDGKKKATPATATDGPTQGGATTESSSTSSTSTPAAPAEASREPSASDHHEEAPVLLSLGDNANEKDVAPTASKDASAVKTNTNGSTTSNGESVPGSLPLLEWDVHGESQIFVISSEAPSPIIPSFTRRSAAPKKTQAASPLTPSPSSASTSSFHRRKSPRAVSIASVFGDNLHQTTSSVRFTSRTTTSANGAGPEREFDSKEEAAEAFRFWTGGSREEVNHEHWKIQSWLLHGLKQKVEHTGSSN